MILLHIVGYFPQNMTVAVKARHRYSDLYSIMDCVLREQRQSLAQKLRLRLARIIPTGITTTTLFVVTVLLVSAPLRLGATPRMPAEIDLMLHVRLAGMEQAEAPRIIDEYILFSYLPEQPPQGRAPHSAVRADIYGTGDDQAAPTVRNPRYVGVVFEHENYRTTHVMFRNEQGVHFMLYPIPDNVRELRYRFVSDGHWSADPRNPNTYSDAHGVRLSVFELPERPTELRSPVLRADGSVEFTLETAPNRRVALVGDFNNWDPFMHEMREIEPGLYQIRLRVPSGRHGYQFVGAGRRINDPLNDRRLHSNEGHDVSELIVP